MKKFGEGKYHNEKEQVTNQPDSAERIEEGQVVDTSSPAANDAGEKLTGNNEGHVPRQKSRSVGTRSGFTSTGDVVEHDPTFQVKRKKKRILIGLSSVLAVLLIGVIYYQVTHVKVRNFVGKPITEVRKWGNDQSVKVTEEQAYDDEVEANNIVKQVPKAGTKVKKKKAIQVTVSMGADPEAVLSLPDFKVTTKQALVDWQKANHADNLTIMEEFDDTVAAGKYLKEEFKDKDVTVTNYKRKNQLVVYYSKGKEALTKSIPMPEFKGKAKAEVEKWVKTNQIEATYKEVASNKIAEGMLVSQSVKANEKIAKRTAITFEISGGKGVAVPDFSDIDMESASDVEGLNIQVKEVFTPDVAYGGLISQSVKAGELVPLKDAPLIKVVYSVGAPYLKAYFGMLEGDLQKSFYSDYRAKGAEIYYDRYYVDSSEERGRVVEMSAYNTYVPMTYTVSIGISNGSQAGPPSLKGDGLEDEKQDKELKAESLEDN
ncbi:PASTA domain-containing protein [Vagococcus coleopterorum]|uniref:PASTA domain-containing protein n=1 Tax=Vagococcus coleopterorum TaxID=2714946 RepID=A0A6G8APH3_9ENTE|nr:PASTA domain-containing protein [Vagococcus coleopterorum]QIL46887.1 PASTA domain-containing protein [Vagococcus coleopterorum]